MTFEISRDDPREHPDDLLGRCRVNHLRQYEAGVDVGRLLALVNK
jgi:hypothetical protein